MACLIIAQLYMNITQIYPQYKKYKRLHGTYLDDPFLSDCDDPIVYSNFLTSLDGRIAVSKNKTLLLPEQLTSDTDHRLFLELQAQADCLITHGGYLRALAAGHLSDILHVGHTKKNADLSDWRLQRGLSAQPLVIVCSNTLEFPMPDSLAKKDAWIATSDNGNEQRIRAWQKQGYKVVVAGKQRVEGGAITKQLIEAGYRRMYLCAGPELFESCLYDRCLTLHYMTLSIQFIGVSQFLTMLAGHSDLKHHRLQLLRLILNEEPIAENNPDVDQLYLTFKVHYSKA